MALSRSPASRPASRPSTARDRRHSGDQYLLRTSDPKMTIEDIAPGYTQLLRVERGWRDLKQVIDLCPARQRKEERTRAQRASPDWLKAAWLASSPACLPEARPR
jgi:hypothetical protein